MNCTVCNKELTGKQTKYCSKTCKYRSTNIKFQNYQAQRTRGISRRLELIELSGGCCSNCGYNKNSAALDFHHLNPDEKKFNIDIRRCSNCTWEKLLEEAGKCVLLCRNCHAETHNPDYLL